MAWCRPVQAQLMKFDSSIKEIVITFSLKNMQPSKIKKEYTCYISITYYGHGKSCYYFHHQEYINKYAQEDNRDGLLTRRSRHLSLAIKKALNILNIKCLHFFKKLMFHMCKQSCYSQCSF